LSKDYRPFEGLIWAARDPVHKTEYNKKKKTSESVLIDPGAADKRLLVTETEFARPIRAMARPTNILSIIIRDAWDTGDLRTMTRSDPVRATGAHVTLIGHITKEELDRELPECDFFNGFANRFLWVEVARSQLLPDGGNLDADVLADYASKLGEALSKARDVEKMGRDEEAGKLWHSVYEDLTADCSGMLGAATSRAEAQVLRISMILALSDGSPVINCAHLRAALAFWDYCFQSARGLFGHKLSDPRAQKILDELRRRPQGMTRWQISEEIFNRNLKTEQITAALQLLLELKLAYWKTEPTNGRDAERWFAAPLTSSSSFSS
jgi:hypothetical protein